IVGDTPGTTAELLLNLIGDPLTALHLEGRLFVGDTAPGSLFIGANADVTSLESRIGNQADGSVTLRHGKNRWKTGNLAVGLDGVGTLVIEDEGVVESDDAFIGFATTPDSSVTVDGTGDVTFASAWATRKLVVGAGVLPDPGGLTPEATLSILGGGLV